MYVGMGCSEAVVSSGFDWWKRGNIGGESDGLWAGKEERQDELHCEVCSRVWTIWQYFLKGDLKILTPWTTCFLDFLEWTMTKKTKQKPNISCSSKFEKCWIYFLQNYSRIIKMLIYMTTQDIVINLESPTLVYQTTFFLNGFFRRTSVPHKVIWKWCYKWLSGTEGLNYWRSEIHGQIYISDMQLWQD